MRKVTPPPDTQALSRHRIRSGEYLRVDIDSAHELLPMVRKITRLAAQELEPLQQHLHNRVPADPRNVRVKLTYRKAVTAWAGKIERLGLKVHGLWQVGFDNGHGWYGWQYPERQIRYFLEYDALFRDRVLLRDSPLELQLVRRVSPT